ncbi:MAG: Lpg1974 family pore-forming outer membrane protein [Pseudomonadota bacterium]
MSGIKLTAILSALTLSLSSAGAFAAKPPAPPMDDPMPVEQTVVVKHHHHVRHHHHVCHTHHHHTNYYKPVHKGAHHCAAHHYHVAQHHYYPAYSAPEAEVAPATYVAPQQNYKGYKDEQYVAAAIPVTIPLTGQRFELTFDPILLKPGASNLNYVIYNNELPVQSPKWYEQELKPKYTFAFLLAGRYVFPDSRDIALDWTHMKSTNTSSSVAAPSASYFLGPDYQIGPAGTVVRNSTGSVNFNYDVINLTVGQLINLGPNLTFHLFGGISDGLLREEVQSTYSGTTGAPFAGPFSLYQDVKANFTGIGPRFGFDSSYNMDCGIGLFGEAAASALIGSTYSATNFVSNAAQLAGLFAGQTNNAQVIRDQHVTQVVPGFDAKLGLNYKHAVGHGMLFTIGAGYQAAVYVNAISQYLPSRLVTGAPFSSGGIFVDTMTRHLSNYSVQGPFLDFSLKF